jgi:hypothetical protein
MPHAFIYEVRERQLRGVGVGPTNPLGQSSAGGSSGSDAASPPPMGCIIDGSTVPPTPTRHSVIMRILS